jgi:iron complex transport system substrate-binding protein
MPDPRIVSLIASSTETLCALGFESQLVGRSHECDYPPTIVNRPPCSEAKFDLDGSSLEIDNRVKDTLRNAVSVYRVFTDVLEQLKPTHIITQDHCEVCAVSFKDVEAAAKELPGSAPTIVSLAPNSLEDIYKGIIEIAESLNAIERGQELVSQMRQRLRKLKELSSTSKTQPSVVCVEWIEPLMAAGNWVPDLIMIAGGIDLLGIPNAHTLKIQLKKLVEADPDKIIVMPCGWDIDKNRSEMDQALQNATWQSLRAVQTGELYITDGNQFFNRPGPRIVESAEILAEIFHPELADFGHRGCGWEKY